MKVYNIDEVEFSIGGKVIKPMTATIKPDPREIARIAEDCIFLYRMKLVDIKFLPRKKKKAAKKRIYNEVRTYMQKTVHNYLSVLPLEIV